MTNWIDYNGLVFWEACGLLFFYLIVKQLYKNDDYRTWPVMRRRLRELATLLLCAMFGPLTCIIGSFFASEGLKPNKSEVEAQEAEAELFEDDVEEVPVGIMMDSVVFCGTRDAVKSAMRSMASNQVNNAVEALEVLQRWSATYSDSRLAIQELFKADGDIIGTYIYGGGGVTYETNTSV